MNKNDKIILPGGAGLVGQNLVVQLKKQGYSNLIVIDKHAANLKILKQLHPDVVCIEEDLVNEGSWQLHVNGAAAIVMLQAQIGSKSSAPFVANNINSTKMVLDAAQKYNIPYIVHISSSVVESVADDDYTETKKKQEDMVIASGIAHCVLRPTLMFGWFDRKHLGWLSRFMKRIPIFPIPGHGRYMRQPLYAADFCRIIENCLRCQPNGNVYNISGHEQVDYIDIIREIKKVQNLKTWILKIPYSLFWLLIATYGVFSNDPPFTTSQLKALTAKDEFELIPWDVIFETSATPFSDAIQETFCDKQYSNIVLDF
ncbi:Putative transmembrane oxidoreductase protein [hydrothermal vent metagenome]|uniref:Transmembrane oxidoreductase protein n=1 Tax=hydrothermal vent metagenome TaxID=652676 RepID=A0A3B0ZVA1_9ZZZZ